MSVSIKSINCGKLLDSKQKKNELKQYSPYCSSFVFIREKSKMPTPSEQCRNAGLASLSELSRISGVSIQTLRNWHKNKPVLFALVIAGAAK
jgi:DNA-directed RNA polymerase subunit RPC12/RpoP